MSKVIILNGPPRSGKDTIASEMSEIVYNVSTASFKKRIIELALFMSGIQRIDWVTRYDELSEAYAVLLEGHKWMKDVPWDRLGGKSQREYLIWISEEVMKPVHGDDYFGRTLVRDIDSRGLEFDYIVSDGGFIDELPPLLEDDRLDVYIVKLYREGCSFAGDSRNYIPREFIEDNNIPCLELYNNKTILGAIGNITDFIYEVEEQKQKKEK